MAALTNSERLVRLETQVETVLEEIRQLRVDLREVSGVYVPSLKHEEDISEIRATVVKNNTDLKKEVAKIHAQRWIQNTLSAILGAVLSLLLAYFIGNVGQ